MKKTIVAVALLLCFVPGAALAGGGDSMDEVLRQLDRMQQQIEAQKKQISDLEQQLGSKVAAKEEGAKEAGTGKIALANKFIDQLTFKGDLRVRYEIRDRDYKTNSDVSRDRFRTRFRVGAIWENDQEDWQVGAGLASGGTSATSTNATWSEDTAFETGDIRLDYAYAKHKWQDFNFILGQQKNPYKSSWVMWDGDVRPTGFTGQYKHASGAFATVGAYGAKLVNDDNTAMLYAGQLGYGGKAGSVGYTLAASYYKYDQSFINDKANTSLGTVDPSQYALEIGDLYGEVKFPVAMVNVSLYGDFWQNFGADGNIGQSQAGASFPKEPDEADTGWVLGVDAKINNFKLGYAYSVVEADSLYGYLADADFGDGLSTTNKQGHRVKLGYNFTKNWSSNITWLSYERDVEIPSASVDSVDLYQFDIMYAF